MILCPESNSPEALKKKTIVQYNQSSGKTFLATDPVGLVTDQVH